jgi:hypothetical protein
MARCKVMPGGERCGNPAAYAVTFTGCAVCSVFGGLPSCAGHYACVDCTALLRTGDYELIPESGLSGDLEPCRVRSLEGFGREAVNDCGEGWVRA